MEPWHLWLIAGIVLITLEMLTPGFFLALVGMAALFAGVGAKLGLPLLGQCSIFVAGSALLLALVRPAVRGLLYRRSDPTLTNAQALIGQTGVVVEPGDGPTSAARVKVGSEVWRAFAPDLAPLPAGAQVTVTCVQGSTLRVQVTASPS